MLQIFKSIGYLFYFEYISLYYLIKDLIYNTDSHNFVCKYHCKYNKIKFIKQTTNNDISLQKTVFLVNHRGFSDFYIDSAILNGTYISRLLVFLLCPWSCLFSHLHNNIIFINRSKCNKKQLEQDIVDNYNLNKNLIVYPEGTRQTSNKSKPLKFGIIRMAYRNNIPIQIIIITNKEKVWSLKKLIYKKNQNCHMFNSKSFYPKDFDNIDLWCRHIETEWHKVWDMAYNQKLFKD